MQVDCDVGAPQVNYRESISQLADIKYTHKKQSGGSGQFAEVSIRFEPGEPGTGFEFRSEIKGGTVPKEYIPGVTKVSYLPSGEKLASASRIMSCLAYKLWSAFGLTECHILEPRGHLNTCPRTLP